MTRNGAPKGATATDFPTDRGDDTTPVARQRDTYADVGRAMRASIERAAKCKLGARDHRVHAAVLALTASWSKLTDETSLEEIAAIAYGVERDDVTGWHRTKVGESLKRLCEFGIIAYAAGRGPGARCRVEIETTTCGGWSLAAPESPPAVGGHSPGKTTRRGAKDHPPWHRKTTRRGDDSERGTEDLPEGDERDPVQVLADGLATNGPAPSPAEVEATIARAHALDLDRDEMLRVIDRSIADGAVFPSHVRVAIEAAVKPVGLDNDGLTRGRAAVEVSRCDRCERLSIDCVCDTAMSIHGGITEVAP